MPVTTIAWSAPRIRSHWDVYSLYNTAKLVGDSDLAKFNGLASAGMESAAGTGRKSHHFSERIVSA